MQTRQRKLAHLLRDADLAAALIKAGLDTPRKIKAASDGQIEAAHGVGKAKRQVVRKRFPKIG